MFTGTKEGITKGRAIGSLGLPPRTAAAFQGISRWHHKSFEALQE
jgi:hypothetical protein